jgi:hypothetical protein
MVPEKRGGLVGVFSWGEDFFSRKDVEPWRRDVGLIKKQITEPVHTNLMILINLLLAHVSYCST